MYELFILGQLMDHSMTGYALRKAFTSIAGDDQAISFGTLYPLLDKLAQAKEISLSFKETENKRPQKLATITDKGKKEFMNLASELVTINKQTQLTFLMKIQFLHLFDQNLQIKILNDFKNFSQGKLDRLKEIKYEIKNNTHMTQEDINDALLVKQLQISRAQTQLKWVVELLNQRKGE
ncbi:PadR family transcriptional regulator [Companilactobacillus nuruki]|uniref:PadR family transcriptional regulator n=1 Tax=Companilactobacillus nuruki TaxID=1993540 RepID=A0A2N7ARD9_9LACO|nr:PadR family transcriptional regulator [Companilactobacillus nuruki]PMD67940.1 PadR family transcriptional regulator [Companilactobacillus nuruki]